MEVDNLMSESEVALFLGVTISMLQKKRARREADLPFVRVGRLVRYRRGDVRAYVERNLTTSELSPFKGER